MRAKKKWLFDISIGSGGLGAKSVAGGARAKARASVPTCLYSGARRTGHEESCRQPFRCHASLLDASDKCGVWKTAHGITACL